MCVCERRRSVQLDQDLFNLVTLQVLLVILATPVRPKHSLRPMSLCKGLKKLPKQSFSH